MPYALSVGFGRDPLDENRLAFVFEKTAPPTGGNTEIFRGHIARGLGLR